MFESGWKSIIRKKLQLPYAFNQGFSYNCWLTSLVMVYLYHHNDLPGAIVIGHGLLKLVGYQGLAFIDSNPVPTLTILRKTGFETLDHAAIFRKLYPKQPILSFKHFDLTVEYLDYAMTNHGPLAISIINEDGQNGHVIVLTAVIQNHNSNAYIKYQDPHDNRNKKMSLHKLNTILDRQMSPDVLDKNFPECRSRIKSTVLFWNKTGKKTFNPLRKFYAPAQNVTPLISKKKTDLLADLQSLFRRYR